MTVNTDAHKGTWKRVATEGKEQYWVHQAQSSRRRVAMKDRNCSDDLLLSIGEIWSLAPYYPIIVAGRSKISTIAVGASPCPRSHGGGQQRKLDLATKMPAEPLLSMVAVSKTS